MKIKHYKLWFILLTEPLKYLSPLKGYSPVRGNVSEADKGVPVFGEKDVCGTQTEGFRRLHQTLLTKYVQTWLT